MRTPEELERLAYINGHAEIAELLGQVIDRDHEIDTLEHALYMAQTQLDDLTL
jgi:hypothetical protein